MSHRLKSFAERMFGIDLRALALFRIGLGLHMIADLVVRAEDLRAFYTDFGALPRNVLLEKFSNPYAFSLLLANGEQWFAVLYFIVAFVFAGLLTVGWRTKFTLFMTWLLNIGLCDRMPGILQGGDILYRIILFWGLFLPLQEKWSVDAALAKERDDEPDQKATSVVSIATATILIQVAMLYVCTALLKTGEEWKNGTAVYYALHIDHFTTRFGQWFRQFPDVLTICTYVTLKVELFTPILFFIPWYRTFFRLLAFVVLVGMHFSFLATMRIALFPFTDLVSLLPLLPPAFFTFANRILVSPKAQRTTIFYDAPCGFCRKSVRILRELIFPDAVQIKTIQTDVTVVAEMEKHRSWIVQSADGSLHNQFDAFCELLKLSKLTLPFYWICNLKPFRQIGTKVYRFVADHRGDAGKLSSVCLPYREIKHRFKFLQYAIVCYGLVFIFLWNAQNIPNSPFKTPQWMKPIGQLMHLDQYWNMFSPFPMKDDGWYVIPGKLDNGTDVDVWNQKVQKADFAKPDLIAYTYPNFRWTKFMINIWTKAMNEYRLPYGRYLCRRWNENVQDDRLRLKTFEIIYMKEDTLPDYKYSAPEKIVIWSHICY